MRRTRTQVRLRVDPIACDGIGACAQFAAAVTFDRWGYPVVGPLVTAADARAALRAVRACPRRALWLEQVVRDQPHPAVTM